MKLDFGLLNSDCGLVSTGARGVDLNDDSRREVNAVRDCRFREFGPRR